MCIKVRFMIFIFIGLIIEGGYRNYFEYFDIRREGRAFFGGRISYS